MAPDATTTAATLTVNPPVTLSPGTLPGGTVSLDYNQTITASGGTGTISLAVSNIQNAINGLVVPLSGTGTLVIGGRPTATGTETFTITATDSVSGTKVAGYSITVSAVTNDNFANRTPITSTLVTITATNVGATKEAGEPNHANNSGGKSVWWTWTAPSAGSVLIDTIGSTFNTILGIYTGSSVSALTAVASDDDSGGNVTSMVTFNAVSGTTYQIAVDGYNGASGNISLFLDLFPGHESADAQPEHVGHGALRHGHHVDQHDRHDGQRPRGDGVQYFFHCLTTGGHDSGWQASATYQDTGLSPNTTYTYQVMTRDQSPAQNQGSYSTSASATTQQVPYTVQTITDPTTGNIEYQMWENGFQFGTLIQTPRAPSVSEGIQIKATSTAGEPRCRRTYTSPAPALTPPAAWSLVPWQESAASKSVLEETCLRRLELRELGAGLPQSPTTQLKRR